METPHVFGEFDHLVGVHTPATIDSRSLHSSHESTEIDCSTAVLLLTPGMLHHVGPYRLHTHIAKELSNLGIPSFRFDLSGIGESLAVGSQGSSLSRATHEIGQAMDFLQSQYGYQQFALFGLCSGADDAIPAAISHDRITAAFLMDGCGYRTLNYWPHRFVKKYLPKMLRWSKWKALAKSLFSRRSWEASATMPLAFDVREFPGKEESLRNIQSLLDRGVHLHFLYTFGVIDYYSYADQFYEMFPELKERWELQVSYLPDMDHTAMLIEDRRDLVHKITHWFDAVLHPPRTAQAETIVSSVPISTPINGSIESKLETAC